MKTFKRDLGRPGGSLGRGLLAPVAAALLLLMAKSARALPASLTLSTSGDCPSAALVMSQLSSIFPEISLKSVGAEAQAEARVVEAPGELTVELRGARRAVREPAADCTERARQASVALALLLAPPTLPEPQSEADGQPSRASPPPQASSYYELAAGPALGLSGVSQRPLALGVGLRAAWGKGVAGVMGLGALWSETLHYPQADARLLMLPFDVGLRVAWQRPDLALGAELAALASSTYLHGVGVAGAEGGFRLDLGLRGALLGNVWLSRALGLQLMESALIWPRPVVVTVGGVGQVGHLPGLWLATQLGLVVRID